MCLGCVRNASLVYDWLFYKTTTTDHHLRVTEHSFMHTDEQINQRLTGLFCIYRIRTKTYIYIYIYISPCLFATVVLRSMATKLGTQKKFINQGRSKLYFYGRIINRCFPRRQNMSRTRCLLQIDKREKFA